MLKSQDAFLLVGSTDVVLFPPRRPSRDRSVTPIPPDSLEDTKHNDSGMLVK